MRSHIEPFVTAIGCVEAGDERDPPGDHLGTGAFFSTPTSRYLLTNEHVATDKPRATLGCELFGSGDAISVANRFVCEPYPVDVAASPISDGGWDLVQHQARCLTLETFAEKHEAVPNEYLYVFGFPGAWARGFAEAYHYVAPAELLTGECPYDPAMDIERPQPLDGYHIFLANNPAHAATILGSRDWLAQSRGMSGSPVWNTRYKEFTARGLEWKPTDARVTGLLWGDTSKAGVFVVTPVQYLLPFLRKL